MGRDRRSTGGILRELMHLNGGVRHKSREELICKFYEERKKKVWDIEENREKNEMGRTKNLQSTASQSL